MQRDWQRAIYRASRLDEYRLYLSGEHYDGSEYMPADFVAKMTEFAETPKMAAGTAVHALIEDAGFGVLPEHAERNGWKVHFDLTAELALPALREIELQRTYRGVPLFGRVDACDALTIHDVKTTSAIDVDRYLDSYQWRAYLWMSGTRSFVYDIFKVKVDEEAMLVTVQDYVPIKLSAYPGMDDDVQSLLMEFDVCVRALGIPSIMERQEAA